MDTDTDDRLPLGGLFNCAIYTYEKLPSGNRLGRQRAPLTSSARNFLPRQAFAFESHQEGSGRISNICIRLAIIVRHKAAHVRNFPRRKTAADLGWCSMQDLLIKAATVFAVALAAFSSFPSPAQQDKQNQPISASVQQVAPSETLAMLQEPSATPTPPQAASPAQPQTATPSQAQPEQQQPAQQPNVKTVQLQLITGELVDKLDSKSAKQGDSVVLKTKEEAKTADGTDIPKGSKLMGHVTNVQARSDDKENSQITLQFDRAELKTGQTLPIASVIESVAPSGGASMAGNNRPMAPASPGAMDAPANGSVPAAGSASAAGSSSASPSNGANPRSPNNEPGMAAAPTGQVTGSEQRCACCGQHRCAQRQCRNPHDVDSRRSAGQQHQRAALLECLRRVAWRKTRRQPRWWNPDGDWGRHNSGHSRQRHESLTLDLLKPRSNSLYRIPGPE